MVWKLKAEAEKHLIVMAELPTNHQQTIFFVSLPNQPWDGRSQGFFAATGEKNSEKETQYFRH